MAINKQTWASNSPITAEKLNIIEENLSILENELHKRITADDPLSCQLGGTGASNNKSIYISKAGVYSTTSSFSIENPFDTFICVQVFSTLSGYLANVFKIVDPGLYTYTVTKDKKRLIFDFNILPYEKVDDGLRNHNYFQVMILGEK